MTNREQFEQWFSKSYSCIAKLFRLNTNGEYENLTVRISWWTWQASRDTYDSLAMQNMKDIAHCMNDLRRFIEMKWPTIADLPSQEAVLLNGPENKHEVDALIAALNRVADFYESEQPVVELPMRQAVCASGYGNGYLVDSAAGDALVYDEVIEALNKAGVKHDG